MTRNKRFSLLAIAIAALGMTTVARAGSFDKDIKELDLQIIFVVPRDAIAAVTNPVLLSADVATWRDDNSDPRAYVADDDRVLGVVRDGVARAYPVNVGWWHEIINDRLGDSSISVTYCPLTGTGLVFDVAKADGSQGELGVSGLLLNGNLVMYDRRDDRSIYPQMTFTGLTGEYRGKALEVLPAVETTWALWKRLYPQTQVPQTGTGLERYTDRIRDTYSSRIRLYREAEDGYPYGGYRTDDRLYFPVTTSVPDLSRYGAKDVVLGICQDGVAKAYPFRTMAPFGVINDRVGNRDVVVLFEPASQTAIPYDRVVGSRRLTFGRVDDPLVDSPLVLADLETGSHWNLLGVAVSGPLAGARLQQVPAYNSMWFAWSAFWPDSEVWEGEDIDPPTLVQSLVGEEEAGNEVVVRIAPNPFNASTHIDYWLPQSNQVRLTIYDTAGQLVRVLLEGSRAAGANTSTWDGRDQSGRPVASGTYRYRLSLLDVGVQHNGGLTLIR